MLKKTLQLGLLGSWVLVAGSITNATPVQIYGSWHCGNDACTWATVRDLNDFDTKNHWMIDRGDGSPSVNLVILSFVNPLKLLNLTNDSGDSQGVPVGMNSAIVSYFTAHNIRVMLSIGGITYTSDWDSALASNATQLGINAAQVAQRLGVGMEIDYENNTSPNLAGVQAFINAYRSILPYDATGANPAARLTIDLAAGDQYFGSQPSAQQRFLCRVELAATHQRLSSNHSTGAAPGSRKGDRQLVHCHRQESSSRMHHF